MKKKMEAMEHGIANTCQSLNGELLTLALTCLTHANDKPESDRTRMTRSLSFSGHSRW